MSPSAHPDAAVMGSLTQKIAQILTAPDRAAPSSAPAAPFLSVAAPGVPLGGSDLDFGDMATRAEIDANAAFSRMVDNVPSPQGFWTLTARKVWDVYEDAVTQVRLPASALSARQQRELDDALALLSCTATIRSAQARAKARQVVRDTPEMAAYMQHQTAYVAALSARNGMEIQANCPGASNSLVQDWARNGASYESLVRGAHDSWVADGYKDNVEAAVGVVRRLAALGPERLYRSLRATFATAELADSTGKVFLPTFIYPTDPPTGLMTALKASWTPFEFTLQDVHTFQPDGRVSSGGSAGAGWGLWSAGSSVWYGAGQRTFPCDTTGLMVQAELLPVPLSRPWMRPEIFPSRGWRWALPVGSGPVSDGGTPPMGQMPLLPTAVVLAQNVMINLDMTAGPNASSWSSVSSGASVGWGPFSIQGNGTHLGAATASHFTRSDGGISVPGPQIVAFVCEVLGRSPDPDPALEWAGLKVVPASV